MNNSNIDNKIKTICKGIDSNIDAHANSDIQLLSQNITTSLRHLAEHVALKIHSSNGQYLNHENYKDIKKAVSFIKSKGQYKWLSQFHSWLQSSVSHYYPDGESAYRLMHKYYVPIVRIKNFLRDKYQLEVLQNLSKFPIRQDSDSQQYYEKIAEAIKAPPFEDRKLPYNDRYYILSNQSIAINGEIHYQITFTTAHNNVSKFDRAIAFSDIEIPSNYAVKLTMSVREIEIYEGVKIPVNIITNFEISIRPCEIDNFSKIFNQDTKNKGNNERQQLMRYLTEQKLNLLDLINLEDAIYAQIKKEILTGYQSVFFPVLDECRALIQEKKPGSNLISYLLFTMNNEVIKKQYNKKGTCDRLSNLRLYWKCIPFDNMPFCTSPRGHNPRVFDLFECLDSENREHEHLARIVKNNTETRSMLYAPMDELVPFFQNDLNTLKDEYNNKLYHKHRSTRGLKIHNEHLYLGCYEDDVISIIKALRRYEESGYPDYENFATNFLDSVDHGIDCDEKKKFLKEAFLKSRVICIYGSAGTGKTTFIKHISDLFDNHSQTFLANTNAAVENLRRRMSSDDDLLNKSDPTLFDDINTQKETFQTITKFLNDPISTEVLFLDESSTVENEDMKELLDATKVKLKILVLVGDIYQIESIRFGNWFSIAKNALLERSIIELTKPYRTDDKKLLELWRLVREGNDAISEHIAHNHYSTNIGQELYTDTRHDDEIILCLNYGGLYGVNNINVFLQAKNFQESYIWGTKIYKVNDPILFNENQSLCPAISNNCKGVIKKIESREGKIIFTIEANIKLSERDVQFSSVKLKSQSGNNSIIEVPVVDKPTSTDNDNHSNQVPFHVAYAVSIHKAQGLEYDSVKVVISDEAEEQITHNIFYTAITRARKHLKIYWSAKTQQDILSRINKNDNTKDWHLLKQKI